jgi:two-component system cell cycle response regulator
VRVLVAEDNPVQRAMLKGLLLQDGHEVTVAQNGVESWEILQSELPPQLAILDWLMPGMSGLEVCQRLRQLEHRPYVFVILLTTNDQREQLLEGLCAGADDYLTKPLDPGVLRARLKVGQRILELQANLIAAKEELRFQADHDSLTGLHNRGATVAQLDREISRARRDRTPLGVIVCDVDHFKRINDTRGHAAGDRALCEVARRITSTVRLYDTVGRVGGEEFLILLPGCDTTRLAIQAERFRQGIANGPLELDGLPIPMTVSLGGASLNLSKPEGAADLIARADAAMYEAKAAGRNGFRISAPQQERDLVEPHAESPLASLASTPGKRYGLSE